MTRKTVANGRTATLRDAEIEIEEAEEVGEEPTVMGADGEASRPLGAAEEREVVEGAERENRARAPERDP